MRYLLATVAILAAAPASAQMAEPTHQVTLTDREINAMNALLDVACKQVGLNGGCREAMYLQDKLNAARQPKPAEKN